VRRRTVLAGLLVATAVLAAVVLRHVLMTAFLALTVVVVARPLYRRLVGYGVQRHVASAITTLAVFLAVVAVATPIGFILYERQSDLEAAIQSLPDELTVVVGGTEYAVETADVQSYLVDYVADVGLEIAGDFPGLGLRFTLFTVIVFGVLLGYDRVGRAIDAIVPPGYDDVYAALKERTQHTLLAIYVLQLATGVATFAVAMPVFYLLGYEFWFTLAVFSGLLQFFPIVGPSLVLLVLAGWHVSTGDVVAAAAVLGIGGVLVAILPDVVVRPYLARAAADLPATLYFVGFIGGLLSLGPVGVIAGPLVVALLAECVELLAAELRNGRQEELPG
jgi:predicted PurR-regulated permease PerM